MYELFEHTADLGLRARAPDLGTLFAETATCLFSAIVEDPAAVRPTAAVAIVIAGDDREYLLYDWLKELLYRFDAEHMVFARFEVHVREDGSGGTARACIDGCGAGSVRCLVISSIVVLATNGGRPVTISNITTPSV